MGVFVRLLECTAIGQLVQLRAFKRMLRNKVASWRQDNLITPIDCCEQF
jgi:hypothetical protein